MKQKIKKNRTEWKFKQKKIEMWTQQFIAFWKVRIKWKQISQKISYWFTNSNMLIIFYYVLPKKKNIHFGSKGRSIPMSGSIFLLSSPKSLETHISLVPVARLNYNQIVWIGWDHETHLKEF